METVILDVGVNPTTVTRTGDAKGILEPGKNLKIETSPEGVDLLDYTAPEGKITAVRVYVFIVEKDI